MIAWTILADGKSAQHKRLHQMQGQCYHKPLVQVGQITMNEADIRKFLQSERLPDSYRTIMVQHLMPLASIVQARQQALTGPMLVGINGAQGTGKTTLAKVLHKLLQTTHGLNVVTFSLDDFYLCRDERRQLAAEVHPLLATRGVPGSHDTELLRATLQRLRQKTSDTVSLPRFSKALDDRLPEAQWSQVNTPVDVILFEGWCVGLTAEPEEALEQPVNTLEASEDRDRRWRQFVNTRLQQDYEPLFATIDYLVMLRAPSFYAVYEWRCLQESRLRETLEARGEDSSGLMDKEQIGRFIQHFERLTRHALQTLPARCDCLLQLDAGHQIEARRCEGNP